MPFHGWSAKVCWQIAFGCNNATLGPAQEGRGRATHCCFCFFFVFFICSTLLALWDGGAALNSAGLAENERVVLEVAAGLRSVQQQVNTGPDGGTFRAMTDKTALFPKGLQSQHGNARSSVTCLCLVNIEIYVMAFCLQMCPKNCSNGCITCDSKFIEIGLFCVKLKSWIYLIRILDYWLVYMDLY